MQLFVALLVIALTLLIVWLKYQQTYWRRRGIPHDEPYFLFGNLKGWRTTKHLIDTLNPIYQKYKGTGPYAGFYFMTRPAVLALDLEFIKNVLIKDFNNFDERGAYHNERDDPLSGNLFSLDGPKWRALRQKLSQTFTSGKMKFMFPTVLKIANEFVAVLGEKVQEADKGILEITDLLGRFTADVIGSCAFGLDCNSLRNPQADFVVIGKLSIVGRRHCKFIDGLMETFPDMARKLGMRQIHPVSHEFYTRIVKETVEYREKNKIKQNDFMSMLIDLKNESNGITLEELTAQAFIFFIAGFETSSTTMGFAFYELAKQPDIQQTLREEINRVLEEHKHEFSYECMRDMKYLDQVISETLRKYPVLPFLLRKTKEHYQTIDPKYYIEKGMRIMLPISAIHYDPNIYPEPDRFDPMRFTDEEIRKRPACAWLPFGDGPRNCIGLRFGKMQAAIGLCYLIRNFKFSVCEKTPSELTFDKPNFLLSSVGGIHLRVEKI